MLKVAPENRVFLPLKAALGNQMTLPLKAAPLNEVCSLLKVASKKNVNVYGPEDLEHVAQELNARPRKTLDWDTPAERLRDLLIAHGPRVLHRPLESASVGICAATYGQFFMVANAGRNVTRRLWIPPFRLVRICWR